MDTHPSINRRPDSMHSFYQRDVLMQTPAEERFLESYTFVFSFIPGYFFSGTYLPTLFSVPA